MVCHIQTRGAVQAGHLHLSDPARLDEMMDFLEYGVPDVSVLGTLTETGAAAHAPW